MTAGAIIDAIGAPPSGAKFPSASGTPPSSAPAAPRAGGLCGAWTSGSCGLHWALIFAAIQVCWARGQDSADSSLRMCHPQDPRAPIDGEEAVRAASVGSVVVSRATPRVRMEYDSGRSAFFCAPDADREPPSHSLRQRRRSQLVISRTGEGKGSGTGRDAPRQPATGRLSTRSPEVLRRQGRRPRHPAVAQGIIRWPRATRLPAQAPPPSHPLRRRSRETLSVPTPAPKQSTKP